MVKTRSRLSGTARTVLNKRRSSDSFKVSGKKVFQKKVSKKKPSHKIKTIWSSKNIGKRDRTQIRDETNYKPERRMRKIIKVLDTVEKVTKNIEKSPNLSDLTQNGDKSPKVRSPNLTNSIKKSSINSGSTKKSNKKASNHDPNNCL